jgi:hypothetical protein
VPCCLAGLVRSGDPVERFWLNDAKAHRVSLIRNCERASLSLAWASVPE